MWYQTMPQVETYPLIPRSPAIGGTALKGSNPRPKTFSPLEPATGVPTRKTLYRWIGLAKTETLVARETVSVLKTYLLTQKPA